MASRFWQFARHRGVRRQAQQLRFARGHRLSMVNQTFVTLPFIATASRNSCVFQPLPLPASAYYRALARQSALSLQFFSNVFRCDQLRLQLGDSSSAFRICSSRVFFGLQIRQLLSASWTARSAREYERSLGNDFAAPSRGPCGAFDRADRASTCLRPVARVDQCPPFSCE
jgi:hypothetical protein